MLDQDRTVILIDLETTISEIADNAAHPLHDVKHKKHLESLTAFNKLLSLREKLIMEVSNDDD